jgi:hypothetical protein
MEQATYKVDNSAREGTLDSVRCLLTSRLGFDLSEDRVLVLEELYVSDVAVVVHLNEREQINQGVQSLTSLYMTSDGDYKDGSNNGVKSVLGNLMYIITNYLEQFGLHVPLYCLISTSPTEGGEATEDNPLLNLVNSLSSDQDWSRGNFAVIFEEQEEVEKVIDNMLLDFCLDKLGPSMEPISPEVFKSRMQEEARSKNLSVDHEELISIIGSCFAHGLQPKQLVGNWVENKLEYIGEKAKRVVS